ncbi:MAG: GNAT family N-acetyltransferase [Nitrospirota bacterium]
MTDDRLYGQTIEGHRHVWKKQKRNQMMIIREWTPEDEVGVRRLFSQCFGKELSHEEWSWKYLDSPWGGAGTVVVDDEQIVAHYGALKTKFYGKGKYYDVFQPCDVMTHPKYRARFFTKKGAMVKAGELFYSVNPMDFAFGFPSERHAILGTKQLGYTEHGYVSVLRKEGLESASFANPLLRIEQAWDAVNPTELDALWLGVKDEYGLTIEKDAKYIFWRYRDHPSRRYEPLLIRNRYKRKLRAFAVLHATEDELCIMDLFCEKMMNVKSVLRLIENKAIQLGLKAVTMWVNPHENLNETLADWGYRSGKGVPYIFKIIREGITAPFLFDNYCYRMGDYDAA